MLRFLSFKLEFLCRLALCTGMSKGRSRVIFRCSFKTIVRNYNPFLVVILEPRVSGVKTDDFIKKNGFDNSHRVEAVGFFGGIWILWRSFIEVEVLANYRQFIHLKICKNNEFVSWAMTIYASPNPMLRR